MAQKRSAKPVQTSIVNFDHENRTYQVDVVKKKVYRRFVEIETSKAFEILSVWRSQHVTV